MSGADLREHIWDRLQDEGLARFPFPPHGRIPNFDGAAEAARRLLNELPESVRAIKVNPDAPQRYVRIGALKRGITVYVPTPRLRGGFWKLDPSEIPDDRLKKAASLSHMKRWGSQIPLGELPPMDWIVAGSVTVDRAGHRLGKGEGYSDLEFAILRELGHPAAPVATTVHPVQIVEAIEADEHDLPIHRIATPDEVITIQNPPPPPDGINWDLLDEEDLDEMPILKEL